MIDEATIQSAKDVDINNILDNFTWERDKDNMMHCPSPGHGDSTPSCSYNPKNNTVRCFGCGKTFDTIGLYQALSEKVAGRRVTFPKAVEEVLALDNQASLQGSTCQQGNIVQQGNTFQHAGITSYNNATTGNVYQTIINNITSPARQNFFQISFKKGLTIY